MSNNSTSVFLSRNIGLRLTPSEARLLILGAFRQAFYIRDTMDQEQIASFLRDRLLEIDAQTKNQIATEIGAGLANNPDLSREEIERWAIVGRILTRSLAYD